MGTGQLHACATAVSRLTHAFYPGLLRYLLGDGYKQGRKSGSGIQVQLLGAPNDMGGHALVPVTQQDSALRGSGGGSEFPHGASVHVLIHIVSGAIP